MVLLFLDIDGVLNAPGQGDVWGDTVRTDIVAVRLNWRDPDSPTVGVSVTWSPRAIAVIRELVSQPNVNASFLSAWGVRASTTFAPLVGLPNNMGYARAPAPGEPGYARTGLWKSVWLLDTIYVGAPPLAVVDDQLTGGGSRRTASPRTAIRRAALHRRPKRTRASPLTNLVACAHGSRELPDGALTNEPRRVPPVPPPPAIDAAQASAAVDPDDGLTAEDHVGWHGRCQRRD